MQASPGESMAADFELTFLGTGTSVGVPVIGCPCRVCHSEDPRDKRTRSSVHVRCGDISVLVDSGPDLRAQALREGLTKVDAVIYTHAHVDHVVGFDELRAFCWHRESPLPLHATPETMGVLKRMFGWAFSTENVFRGYIKPDPHLIEGPLTVGDLRIVPLPVQHAKADTVGFLFEPSSGPMRGEGEMRILNVASLSFSVRCNQARCSAPQMVFAGPSGSLFGVR